MTDRRHVTWVFVSAVLLIATIAGIVTEAGPTAVVSVCLVAVTLYMRTPSRDHLRLRVSAVVFLLLGVTAAVAPTAEGCGVALVESAQHGFEPTPHVHGPCEQANDRRAIAAYALALGGGATGLMARRRRREAGDHTEQGAAVHDG